MERQFNANIDITHEGCGHTQSVDVIGLTEETDINCAGCGEVFRLDDEVIEKIHEDFVEMLADKFADADIDVDDWAVFAFARIHGRLPTEPGDDISPWQ
jgi:hypothetical protein